VVERAKQQHGLDAGVGVVEAPRVADARARERPRRLTRGRGPRLVDMERARVHQVHLVAQPGEPARVRARAAADVEHDVAARRQVAQDDLLRARQLEPARALEESRRLGGPGVVRHDLGRERLACHRPA